MATMNQMKLVNMSNELKTKYEGMLKMLPSRNQFFKKLTPKPMKAASETYPYELSSRRGGGPSTIDGAYRVGKVVKPLKANFVLVKNTTGVDIGADTMRMMGSDEFSFWDGINGQVERLYEDMDSILEEQMLGKGKGILCKVLAVAGNDITVDNPDNIANGQLYDTFAGIKFDGTDVAHGADFSVDSRDGNVLTVSAAGTTAVGDYLYLANTRELTLNMSFTSLFEAASANAVIDGLSPITDPEVGGIEFNNGGTPYEWSQAMFERGMKKQRNNSGKNGTKVREILIHADNLVALKNEGYAYRRFADAKMQFGAKDSDIVMSYGSKDIVITTLDKMPRDYILGIPELTSKSLEVKQLYPLGFANENGNHFFTVGDGAGGPTAMKRLIIEWMMAVRYMCRSNFILWNGVKTVDPEYSKSA